MRNLYIVSDVHGNYEGLQTALLNAGLLVDKPGRGLVKKRDAFVLQIGDLTNCVRDSIDDDLRCLDTVGSWIDLMLVGNHEIPYFDPSNTFSGFHFNKDIGNRLWKLYNEGLLDSAFLNQYISPALVTHAGISRSQLNFWTGTTALLVQKKLQVEWHGKNFNHCLFSDVGAARYGRSEIGGVLWCDFDKEFEPTEFPQIVGHTSGILRMKGNALCIDTQRINNGVPTVLKLEA